MKIKAKKIHKKSLFKLIFVSQIVPMGMFMLICGIAALMGADTVKVNDSQVTGVAGLISAIIMYPIFLFIFSGVIWIGSSLGLWSYSWFRNIEVEFVNGHVIEENEQNQSSEPTLKAPGDPVDG